MNSEVFRDILSAQSITKEEMQHFVTSLGAILQAVPTCKGFWAKYKKIFIHPLSITAYPFQGDRGQDRLKVTHRVDTETNTIHPHIHTHRKLGGQQV